MTFRGLLLTSCKSDSLPTKLIKIGYIAQHGKKGKKMQMKATKFYFQHLCNLCSTEAISGINRIMVNVEVEKKYQLTDTTDCSMSFTQKGLSLH